MVFSMIFSTIVLIRSTYWLEPPPIFVSPSNGFIAPLIHRSFPESPFFDPNATYYDIMRDSWRTSLARSAYFHWLLSSKSSIEHSITPVEPLRSNYVMKYSIGTPPVEAFAVPDTGSPLIWMQCVKCRKCSKSIQYYSDQCLYCKKRYKQSMPYFDPGKSSSYQQVIDTDDDCRNNAPLATGLGVTEECTHWDGSYVAGIFGKETLTFQDRLDGNKNIYSLTSMFFACGHKKIHVRGGGIPGVVGLSNHPYSFVGQLSFDTFSYCLSSNVTAGHSQIRFGLAAIISGKATTAYYPNKGGYYLFKNVEGLYVDGEKVEGIPEWVFQYAPGGFGGLLLDSGTTFSELYGLALDQLIGKIRSKIPGDVKEGKDATNLWDLCYNLGQRPVVLPEIEFRFSDSKGNTFPLSDNNAWIDNNHGQFCLALGRSTGAISILGMYQQRDVNVRFDLKQHQLTFLYNMNCRQYG